MIVKLKFNCETKDDFDEVEACIKGARYKRLIDELYEDVFREHFKYEKPIIGDDLRSRDLDVINAIWEKCKEHLEIGE